MIENEIRRIYAGLYQGKKNVETNFDDSDLSIRVDQNFIFDDLV